MLNGSRFELASIERRRNNERERKERIFNDKLRTIGIDKEGLDKQLDDKKKGKDAERLEQDTFEAQFLHNSKQAYLLQNKEEKERRAKEKTSLLEQYERARQEELDRDDSEEVVEHMMPPGMAGEDPDSESRICRQKEQLREWLLQQQTEQAVEKERQNMEKLDNEKFRVHMDNVALQLENTEMEMRKQNAVKMNEFNQAMAEERQRQERELKDDPREIQPSQVGVPGIFHSYDRRPRPESYQQMKKFWNLQVEEKMMTKLEGIREKQQYARWCSNTARTALIIQRQQERQKKELRQELDHNNSTTAEFDRRNRPDIKRGRIDESFFAMFNTCSR
ncbi:RIB43A-like with coiled-coils protein 2 [Phyllopteryx taeniolatus]|uniref:RIB43A-like with coiled-coils protein 2 n=1 Tax=Phyllopteryx taeniolatus TaxID=161469 RepID=UPI002AD3D6E4|nr:RIB43A-like with coiled-coils protein 2 [Phyllopteryx taeniolatus]